MNIIQEMPQEINLITKIEQVRKTIRQHRQLLKKLKDQYDEVTIDIQKEIGRLQAFTEIKETGIFKILVPDTTSAPVENVGASHAVKMEEHEHDHGHSHGHENVKASHVVKMEEHDHSDETHCREVEDQKNENNHNHMGHDCNCPPGEDCNCDDKEVTHDWDDSEMDAPIVPLNDLYTQFKVM
jgi:hypothetical protein